MGPPTKPFDTHEAEIVKDAYLRYKFGTRMLERIIRKVYKVNNPIIVSICISLQLTWQALSLTNRNGASGFDMSESIACLQAILIGMRMNVQDSRYVLSKTMPPGRSWPEVSSRKSILRTAYTS
jgi:hypothetical protein